MKCFMEFTAFCVDDLNMYMCGTIKRPDIGELHIVVKLRSDSYAVICVHCARDD